MTQVLVKMKQGRKTIRRQNQKVNHPKKIAKRKRYYLTRF